MPTVPKNAKTPQDRKVAEVETALSPEETPGWDLMKPMDEIPVWDQTPLIALLQNAFEDSDKLSDEVIDAMTEEEFAAHKAGQARSFDVNIIGTLAKSIMPYAKDQAEYTKFVSGSGAMGRAMALAMAWVGQMGEFASSEA